MVATYQRANSYEDRGTKTVAFSGPRPHTIRAPFETTFVRSDGFRFESRNGYGPTPTILWMSAGKIHRYVKGGTIEDEPNLAGASFYSGIPSLLLPTLAPGRSVSGLTRLRLAPQNDLVDGHPCWRVVGTDRSGEDLTLWIDQATHVLRRTSERRHFDAAIATPAFDTETTTSYVPLLNSNIEASRLRGPDPASIPPPRTEPWLGLAFQPDSNRITRVLAKAPGERAGLMPGDEIVSADGISITNASALVAHVQTKSVGTTVTLVIRRGANQLTISVELADRFGYAELQRQLRDKPAPPFAASVATGPYPATLTGLAGSLILLDFTETTFSYCKDCGTPAEFMSKLQDKYAARGLRVVGVSMEDATTLQKFSSDHQLHYTLAHDDGTISNAYLIHGPTTAVFIDRAGVVRFMAYNQSGIEPLVEWLLDDAKPAR